MSGDGDLNIKLLEVLTRAIIDQTAALQNISETVGDIAVVLKKNRQHVEDRHYCCICFDRLADVCIVHGDSGHSSFCYDCVKECDECPICRRPIEKLIHTFKT